MRSSAPLQEGSHVLSLTAPVGDTDKDCKAIAVDVVCLVRSDCLRHSGLRAPVVTQPAETAASSSKMEGFARALVRLTVGLVFLTVVIAVLTAVLVVRDL